MSNAPNPEILLHVTENIVLNARYIEGTPEVNVYSSSQKKLKPAKASAFREIDGKQTVLVEYSDKSGHKWVPLDTLQHDNNNAIRLLFGAKNEEA